MSIFEKWNLESTILDAIKSRGWTSPTEIQADAIPFARKGRDIVGQAKTGSGKTAAFGIPILEKCEKKGIPQSLILCPTRELAVQVTEEMNLLQGKKGLQIISVYGGTDIEKQAKKLSDGCDIVVGTPGRVIDMSKKGHLKLQDISIFCLDEADRMLDMGFFPDILWVIEKMPNRSQTLLFSATFPEEVLNVAEEFMVNAEHVMSDDLEVDIPEIDLYAVRIGRANKLWVLGRIIANMTEEGQMLIFSNTKRMVDVIVERLGKFQMKAVGIHGDMPQNKRERLLNDFRSGKEKIVVATDVAARGLDVDGITVVVNYDLPDDTESFVHRIGRTGRMGRKGEAWSLVSKEDRGSVEKICSTWGLTIPFVEAPSLPEGIDRDLVRKREDWDEVADSFGMVRINLDIGQNDLTKRALADWIVKLAKISEIVVGEITQSDEQSQVEIHVAKVAYVIDVIKARDYNGRKVKPVIVES
ncbi:MAG: DEAD/DEAH box helicase [Euryarchaeota archaeon]|jgi:ATP-dependent RNA helicase DeaD|nr:DEAD/DEAH box helicase [Euryarchaeota archaeon]MBT3847408.1 DEAD/DEAH box helicase [Euryarchaeota archaeon]MBT5639726.1 DEAD/DEAH box helicase [Euryarchaeota archaeon]MBT6072410.1 DEAD/DEAH box helicase [Euryarchaeota archaeon]MBT6075776.1 DEAD/DEAH box helicase [Euryarchaeota archaeon]